MRDGSRNMVADKGSKHDQISTKRRKQERSDLDMKNNGVINYDYLHDNQIKSHRGNMEFGEGGDKEDVILRESPKSFVEQKRQQNKLEQENFSRDHDFLVDGLGNKIEGNESKIGILNTTSRAKVFKPIKSNNKSKDSETAAAATTTEKYNQIKIDFGKLHKTSSPVITNTNKSFHEQKQEKVHFRGSENNLYGFDKPLAREGHHQHSINWSHEGIARAQPLAANNLTYGGQVSNSILTTGLPILLFILSLVILWHLFKYLQRICYCVYKTIKNGKIAKKLSKQEPQVVIDIDPKKFQLQDQHQTNNVLGLISNGKVLDSFKGFQINEQKLNHNTQYHQHKLEIDQLSINMEENTTSNDSDEPSNERKTLTKRLIGSFKINMLKKNSQQMEGQQPLNNNQNSQTIREFAQFGKIKYSISYDFSQSTLSVEIIEAADLPGLDLCGSSDPYVKIYFDDQEKKHYEKTRVHKNTLNPIFNEKFEFKITYTELISKTLVLALYDFDKFSKHDEIGQVMIPISSIDLAQTHEEWRELTRISTTSNSENLGDICLSLRYVPTANKLTVVVIECRKLKKMDIAGLSDPYVKLVLLNDNDKRLNKKKTSIKRCTLNPHYNEAFTFDIPVEEIKKVKLVITVVDYDRIGASEEIGRVVLGCGDSYGDWESKHWKEMLASPRRPVAQWHTLKNIDRKYTVTNLERNKVVGSRSMAL